MDCRSFLNGACTNLGVRGNKCVMTNKCKFYSSPLPVKAVVEPEPAPVVEEVVEVDEVMEEVVEEATEDIEVEEDKPWYKI